MRHRGYPLREQRSSSSQSSPLFLSLLNSRLGSRIWKKNKNKEEYKKNLKIKAKKPENTRHERIKEPKVSCFSLIFELFQLFFS